MLSINSVSFLLVLVGSLNPIAMILIQQGLEAVQKV